MTSNKVQQFERITRLALAIFMASWSLTPPLLAEDFTVVPTEGLYESENIIEMRQVNVDKSGAEALTIDSGNFQQIGPADSTEDMQASPLDIPEEELDIQEEEEGANTSPADSNEPMQEEQSDVPAEEEDTNTPPKGESFVQEGGPSTLDRVVDVATTVTLAPMVRWLYYRWTRPNNNNNEQPRIEQPRDIMLVPNPLAPVVGPGMVPIPDRRNDRRE